MNITDESKKTIKTYYEDFKDKWLSTYIKQYKESNNAQKRAIKDNIYKNIQLTDKEKDDIWANIIRRS